MTTTLVLPPGERGVVRVFAVDLPPEEARAFAADPDALSRALDGAVDPARAEVFPVSRLAGMGLRGYLAEGHGIAAADLAGDAARLDALDGHVAVVPSAAFGAEGRTVAVGPPLRLVGTWREESAPVVFGDLPSAGAAGTLAGPASAPPPPGQGGRHSRLLAILLLVLAAVGFIALGGGR